MSKKHETENCEKVTEDNFLDDSELLEDGEEDCPEDEEGELTPKQKARKEFFEKERERFSGPEWSRNPVKAIRKFCLGCLGNSQTEIILCSVKTCPLLPFRNGRNIYRTSSRVITQDQKDAARVRMRQMWDKKITNKTDAVVNGEELVISNIEEKKKVVKVVKKK